ncbi:hypothetical protein COLO4_11586 [Corchorus olitorius]|uniref:Uncharacterized protein n=1 Tax=Corchorus olitorius TaxID=93759 RepID=A0A1R3K406_9ROSI|nr:hypothetical protein COLO4_11586 [Corchorus olitorius]
MANITAAKASTTSAAAWISQINHGQICCSSSCRRNESSSSFCSFSSFRGGLSYAGRLLRERKRSSAVKGINGEAKINGNKFYDVSEEDLRFVEVFREAQTYIRLHRGSTFVLLLSAEIVATPNYLDTILQVK